MNQQNLTNWNIILQQLRLQSEEVRKSIPYSLSDILETTAWLGQLD